MRENFDPQRFRQALGTFTTGVTIITTVDAAGTDVGVTANSFNSVSLNPPMVLWSLGRSSTNIDAFLTARHFAVHILASDQDALAHRFSQRGVDRFAGLQTARGLGGVPLLGGCASRFECRTAFQHEGGDHVIFVGEVAGFEYWEREPLVFKRGRFAFAVGKTRLPLGSNPAPATLSDTMVSRRLIHLLERAHHQLHLQVKPELLRHKIGDAEYLALRFLSTQEGQTAQELDSIFANIAHGINYGMAEKLGELGLVDRQLDSVGRERIQLTAEGQRCLEEILAVAQVASVGAEEALDPSESHVLRQLLATIIKASDPGVPHPWTE